MSISYNKARVGKFDYPTLSIDRLETGSQGTNKPQNTSPIHFTGANGFIAAVYTDFLSQFSTTHSVTAADCRGALLDRNRPPKQFGLPGFADDLIALIETMHSKPVIGMGHSFGAHVSLIAAIKRPDLFEKLVLIEPASLPNPLLDLYYRKLPKLILHKMLPMIKRTQERQRVWPNRQSFIDKYQAHPTFKHFTNSAMQAYAQHGLYERADGQFELVFDPDWEAYIFSNVEFVWKNLKKSQTPCLFLRAEHSNLYSSQRFHKENAKLGSHFTGVEIENTHHMMPLEAPAICYRTINEWLRPREPRTENRNRKPGQ